MTRQTQRFMGGVDVGLSDRRRRRGSCQQPGTGGSDGWTIPDGAPSERNPVVMDAGVLAGGQRLYKSKCERCHGADGSGHGPTQTESRPGG